MNRLRQTIPSCLDHISHRTTLSSAVRLTLALWFCCFTGGLADAAETALSLSEKGIGGSTGYQPVPSGNLPDGTGAAPAANTDAGFGVTLAAAPVGKLPALPALGTGSQVLTPQQVVRDTLAHSHRLKILDNEVAAAEARQSHARAQGWPEFSGDARAASYTGPEDSRLGPAISIPFIENRYSAGLTVSQPLYAGGRIQAAKQTAALEKKAAQENRLGTEADVIFQALTAYWNWSKAQTGLASLQAAVTRMEAHAQDMRNLQRAGLATDNESLATEVQLDQTRLRFDEARRQLEVAEARITFLAGQPPPPGSVAVPAAAKEEQTSLSESELLRAAMSQRSEREARRVELRAAEAAVKSSRAGARPQISLFARYEQARPNLLSIPPEDRWQNDAVAGVSLSWNLFDFGRTKAKMSEASARVAQAKARREQTDEEIALEVREARFSFQTALRRVTVAERAEQSAQRNLQSATSLWQNGLARHTDVLDAHALLTDAQSEAAAARADLELARAALDHATGRLRSVWASDSAALPRP